MASPPPRRSRAVLGLVLQVAAVVAVVSVGVGWAAALTLGTVLPEDATRRWDGGRWYVAGVDLQPAVCRILTPDGPPRALGVNQDRPRRGSQDLAQVQQALVLGGGWLRPDAEVREGTLRCTGDVRVLTGALAVLPAPAEGGLWLVLPVAVAGATGAALRRR